jgi:hypothetical protein
MACQKTKKASSSICTIDTKSNNHAPRKGRITKGKRYVLYISRKKRFRIVVCQKRLSDFNGTEGAKYHVRQRARLFDCTDEQGIARIPVYIYREGKLKRCPQKTITPVDLSEY